MFRRYLIIMVYCLNSRLEQRSTERMVGLILGVCSTGISSLSWIQVTETQQLPNKSNDTTFNPKCYLTYVILSLCDSQLHVISSQLIKTHSMERKSPLYLPCLAFIIWYIETLVSAHQACHARVELCRALVCPFSQTTFLCQSGG